MWLLPNNFGGNYITSDVTFKLNPEVKTINKKDRMTPNKKHESQRKLTCSTNSFGLMNTPLNGCNCEKMKRVKCTDQMQVLCPY